METAELEDRLAALEAAIGRAIRSAAAFPGLVAEWDREANAPLRPERIKATYDRTVQWRCLADPTHPPYRMSPRTRGKTAIGCPIHRPMARTALARRRQLAA